MFLQPEYTTLGEPPYDFAICTLTAPLDICWYWGVRTGLRPSSVTGWNLYGYPADPPFDGEKMFSDAGPNITNPPGGGLSFMISMANNIDLTGGASGGPWLPNPGGLDTSAAKILSPGIGLGGRSLFASGITSGNFVGTNVSISPQFGLLVSEFAPAVFDETGSPLNGVSIPGCS